MTNIEKLIEVVSYAEDSGTEWWKELDTPTEAASLLRRAARERPSDEEIEYLLVLIDIDPFEVETTPWTQCIQMLEDQIEIEEE